MDWLQFIASIVSSVAWPLGVVLVAVVLRRALIELLPRIKRFKLSGVEAEFSEVLEKAEQDSADLPQLDVLSGRSDEKPVLETFSNNSAIFVAWLQVEAAILNLARKHEILQPNMTALRAAKILRDSQAIGGDIFRSIEDLNELRNIAVHPGQSRVISDEEFERFKVLAERVRKVLEN